ncbi:MAG: hypothetical protein KBC92_15970, partial [Giesbergeria sp.]|nr:hypothetical protein [Giesbergeria sp.]
MNFRPLGCSGIGQAPVYAVGRITVSDFPHLALPMPAPRPLAPAVQKALHKLGLRRDIDLALHLPLRYED